MQSRLSQNKNQFFLDFSWSFSKVGGSGAFELTLGWRWCIFVGEKGSFQLIFFITGQKGRNLWVTLFSGPCLVYPYSGRWRHCFIRLWCHVGWPISAPNSDSHPRHSKDTWTFSPRCLWEFRENKPRIFRKFRYFRLFWLSSRTDFD